ncbi:unnamed protein product [Camellia sinensis]
MSYNYFVMDSEEAEYATFKEKVRKNVYIDNLSPQVTEAVLRTALNQFGIVEKVQFIPNCIEPRNIPRCALVEMENSKQAKQIVSEMGNFPFMMSGMPRPVRARAAEMEMFEDHPRKPGRKIKFHWLDPQDPDFKVAKELKLQTRKHAAESSFALKVTCVAKLAISTSNWKDQIEIIVTKLFKQYRVKSNLDQKCNVPNLKGMAPWSINAWGWGCASSKISSLKPPRCKQFFWGRSIQGKALGLIETPASGRWDWSFRLEKKLANKQAETLKANYEKYELIEGVLNDGSANRLARHYNMKSLKKPPLARERKEEEEESRSPKDSRIPFQAYSYFVMDSEEAEYAAFEEKVRRNVYIDNLSPQVTEAVLRTALNQFGNVEKVQFIPNYTEPRNIPRCALVEMENSKQAKQIVSEMVNFPFMMSGMPRPVRARAAEMEMFDDHPRKPGRKIKFHWLDPQDPDFTVAKELKLLTRKHAAESSFALKVQLAQEEKLANKQAETLKANYEKYELIEGVLNDGSANRLARHYSMKSL